MQFVDGYNASTRKMENFYHSLEFSIFVGRLQSFQPQIISCQLNVFHLLTFALSLGWLLCHTELLGVHQMFSIADTKL